MKGFLEYVEGNSLLHRMNPVAKLACALLIAVACFSCDNLFVLLAIVAFGYALAASCGMAKQALGLTKAVVAFSVILALIALLTTEAGPSDIVLVPLPWGSISTASLLAAVLIILRLVGAAIPMFLTFYVTKINDISNSFVKVLHVPYKYAFTFASTVKFIPVFLNDMSGVMEAQTARGVEFDCGFIHKLKLMIPLCVPLLVSSVRKANSSAIAAEVRGFNLRTRQSGYREYPFAARDWVALVLCVVLLVVGVLL